jgi:hypothetical protein
MRRRRAGLLFILAFAGIGAVNHPDSRDAVSRAAPGVIVFTGGPLQKAIVLSDWNENQRLMLATARRVALADTTLARRLKIEVSMYWGATWSHYAATPDSLALLSRVREAQRGAYYPASRDQAAVWVFGPMGATASSTRLLGAEGVAILRAHHLPVAVE